MMRSLLDYIKGDYRESLINREESIAIKGLLIALILLGHDKYLMEGRISFIFLYTFHVYCFYFLPFLYNWRLHKFWPYLWKNLYKFYIPYLICVFIIYLITIYRGMPIDISDVVRTICTGNVYGNLSMGSFLWFLPTMFILLMVKELYYRSSIYIRYAWLIFSFICLANFGIGWFDCLCQYFPYMIRNGLAMLLPGFFCRYLFENVHRKEYFSILFLFVVIADFVIYPTNLFYPYSILTRFISPVFIFVFIICQKNVLKDSKVLINLGNYSFPIYLVHIFIYNIIYLIIEKYIEPNLLLGFILYIVVITLSFVISYIAFCLAKKCQN